MDERKDVEAVEFGAAFQECEFDGEGSAFDPASEFFDQLGCGSGSSPGGEEIIANNDALAGLDGVFVDFERVGAVFESVGNAGGFGGKLFRLAYGHKTRAKAVSQSRGKNEAARFDSGDHVNLVAAVVIAERIDELVKSLLVLEEGGEIIKEDAGLGIIGDFAN